MSEEWRTPISKEKIIDRRNRLIEYQKTNQARFTTLYQIIDENILAINYMIYEIERLNKENKILRENAEHNDKVVDKVNWENKRLNNIIKEFEIIIKNEINESKLEEDYERVDILRYCLATLQELKHKKIYGSVGIKFVYFDELGVDKE